MLWCPTTIFILGLCHFFLFHCRCHFYHFSAYCFRFDFCCSCFRFWSGFCCSCFHSVSVAAVSVLFLLQLFQFLASYRRETFQLLLRPMVCLAEITSLWDFLSWHRYWRSRTIYNFVNPDGTRCDNWSCCCLSKEQLCSFNYFHWLLSEVVDIFRRFPLEI